MRLALPPGIGPIHSCDWLSLQVVPEGDWSCPVCEAEGAAAANGSAAKGVKRAEGTNGSPGKSISPCLVVDALRKRASSLGRLKASFHLRQQVC